MLNFLIVGDVHSADKNPKSRIDNYFEDTFNLIDQIGLIASKIEANGVFFLGDLFHHKSQKDNSCKLISRWIESLKNYPATYVIAGNHDESFNNPDTVPEQPLGLLQSAGAINLLDQRFEIDKVFTDRGVKVRFAGYPYEEKRGLDVCNIRKGPENLLVTLAHIYAGPKREDLFGTPIYGYDEMTNFESDIFAFGHYHKDQGITELEGKSFINLGAITRGSLSYEDITRQPKIAWLQVDQEGQYTIKKIKLKVKAADEIFDLEKKEKQEKERNDIEKFIESLDENLVTDSGKDSVYDSVKKLSLEKPVESMVLKYLRESE